MVLKDQNLLKTKKLVERHNHPLPEELRCFSESTLHVAQTRIYVAPVIDLLRIVVGFITNMILLTLL